jgi:hypothetical protein
MQVIPRPSFLQRLDHIADSDARCYAAGLLQGEQKHVLEQHITACSLCLMKLRRALQIYT